MSNRKLFRRRNVALATNSYIHAIKVLKISDVQFETLKKLDSYNINVAQFIRDAISDKIKKEYQSLIPKHKNERPF